jgi:small GTP-binding protein
VNFDVTSPVSLKNVEQKWIPEITRHCPQVPFVLVGTKIDLRKSKDTETCISTEEGIATAQRLKAKLYVECSALEGTGVTDVFVNSVQTIFDI